MKMKRSVKISLIVLGAALLAVLVVVLNVSRSNSQVRGLEADIRYGSTPMLVSGQTVVDSVVAALPTLMQQQVKAVDCEAVAEAARRVPFLTNVSASVSVSGRVVVRADQRRPIARLFHGDRERYLDREGAVFPVSRVGNCNVLVAGGDFTAPCAPIVSTHSSPPSGRWPPTSTLKAATPNSSTRYSSSATATL